MPYTVYLSSTRNDLEAERAAVQDALKDICVVRHSYLASEDALVPSCLDDVVSCDLYILILGLRYGHIPQGKFPNPEDLSITELEYRHAEGRSPRLVFLKSEDAIPFSQTDAKTKEHPPERIEGFRTRAARGDDQRPAIFATVPELREQILKAFREFERRNQRPNYDVGEAPGAAPPAVDHDEVRRGYIAWLAEECEKVLLLGLGARERQNVRLGQVYVPALTSRSDRGDVSAIERGEYLLEPLLNRLGRESLYVPGAPGSGKSTFCRWAALAVAAGDVPSHAHSVPNKFSEVFPASLRGRFPLLCPLREWSADARWLAGNGQWRRGQLEAALSAWIDTVRPGGLTSGAFLDVLGRGSAVVILDGADEIPERIDQHYPRLNFLTGLADAHTPWTKAGNRVLLTSRPYGVESAMQGSLNLAAAEVSGLPRELQDVFVRRWYAAAGTKDDARKAAALIGHLDGRPDLEELRPNPMLLTALCVKFDEDLRLPGDLYRLYGAVTDQVLYKRFPTESERDVVRLRLSAVALAMHWGPADHPRINPAPEVSIEEIDDALSELARTDRASEQAGIAASEKREQLLSTSGLLLPRENRRAAFYHLSFQEFLAALRLRRLSGDCRPIVKQFMATPQWRPTLRFLFCATADQSSPEQALSDYSLLLDHLDGDRLASDPNPALLLADCLEVGHARGWNLLEFGGPFRRACDIALDRVEPPARARLWDALGRIGLDDRPGVGVKDGVPDIDWVEVPAGRFKYGEYQRSIDLPAFRIARYPVTNAQFQAFIGHEGFDSDEWWQWPERRRPAERPCWSGPNLPRETVSWWDATAFCGWLEARLRERGELEPSETIGLPTEEQWEKAARGSDGREYPWGGDRYEAGRANIDETFDNAGPFFLKSTSAVGIYPHGASPSGVLDMGGNVWEWCAGNFDPGKKEADATKVVRGGSWDALHDGARTSLRVDDHPNSRNFIIGFRVVCVSRARQ